MKARQFFNWAFAVAFVAALFLAVKFELEHPCLEYGPEEIAYWQTVDGTMYPVYAKPCLVRR